MAQNEPPAKKGQVQTTSPEMQTEVPPIGVTPPQVLAQEAADGHRGAAWRLMHWIMENDPRAVEAVSSLDDDRLAKYFLEFIALGTWAGKPFVVPKSLRTPYARTQLRTLFQPGAGIDSTRAERVLLDALKDRHTSVRENAINILGLLGCTRAVPALVEELHDPQLTIRLQAAKALGRIRSAEAVPALLKELKEADEPLNSQVFIALVQIGPRATPALIEASKSPSSWMRWHCMRALGEIQDERAIPTLVQALLDNDHAVAWIAAKGLVNFGKDAIGPLLNLLTRVETSPWLAETAAYVLYEISMRYTRLKPYLEPVEQAIHGVASRIATPYAARKALSCLIADHVIAG